MSLHGIALCTEKPRARAEPAARAFHRATARTRAFERLARPARRVRMVSRYITRFICMHGPTRLVRIVRYRPTPGRFHSQRYRLLRLQVELLEVFQVHAFASSGWLGPSDR